MLCDSFTHNCFRFGERVRPKDGGRIAIALVLQSHPAIPIVPWPSSHGPRAEPKKSIRLRANAVEFSMCIMCGAFEIVVNSALGI